MSKELLLERLLVHYLSMVLESALLPPPPELDILRLALVIEEALGDNCAAIELSSGLLADAAAWKGWFWLFSL